MSFVFVDLKLSSFSAPTNAFASLDAGSGATVLTGRAAGASFFGRLRFEAIMSDAMTERHNTRAAPTSTPTPPARRKPRAEALAELIDGCMAPALAKQGFASGDVIAAWPEIVGAHLAAFSQPVKLEWSRRHGPRDPERAPDPATLVVRVEGAFALDFQQSVPLVIERLNAHYGWACIGRVVIRQGPVTRPPERVAPPAPSDPAIARKVAAKVDTIADPALRAALARFGEAVIAGKGKPGGLPNVGRSRER